MYKLIASVVALMVFAPSLASKEPLVWPLQKKNNFVKARHATKWQRNNSVFEVTNVKIE